MPLRVLFRMIGAIVKLCGRLMGFEGSAAVVDGKQYEVFVAKYLKEQGFRQIRHTGATGDFGVDIVAKKHGIRYAVQCKFYSSSVSGAAVQEAVAGMAYYHCDRAMVVTNSGLTRGAKKLAEVNEVLVLEYVEPGQVSVASVATPESIISIAVCAVLSVWLLPKIRTGEATALWIYVIVVALCYLGPRLVLRLLRCLWQHVYERK